MASIIPDNLYQKLIDGVRGYYDDPINARPTTFLAMFETADGCIKFMDMEKAPPTFTFAMSRVIAVLNKADPLDQLKTKVTKRTYALSDRSGPGGMILHYKEVVE